MQMIGHEAEMQHLYFGVERRDSEQPINDRITKIRTLNEGFGGVLFGDLKRAEERLAAGYGEGNMIERGAFPCFAGHLPMPCVMIIRHNYIRNRAQRYEKNRTYANI